jgi:hypothetical protein
VPRHHEYSEYPRTLRTQNTTCLPMRHLPPQAVATEQPYRLHDGRFSARSGWPVQCAVARSLREYSEYPL